MKKILAIFLLLFTLTLSAQTEYSNFLKSQIEIVYKMNEANVTQTQIEELFKERNVLYNRAFNKILSNKEGYLKSLNLYETEIFSLEKMVEINKRAGNKYAELRDEVKMKTYLVLQSRNLALKDILNALDEPSVEEYEKKLNLYISKHEKQIRELYKEDYSSYLSLDSSSSLIEELQRNIREFYALNEINKDSINYLHRYEGKMYNLNRYAKYHLMSVAIFINSNPFVQELDASLISYGLSTLKLTFILFLIVVIFIFRKIVYVAIENYILRIDAIKRYSKQILEVQRKPIELLIIIVNIHMVIYVYNNFSIDELFSRTFSIIYGSLITYTLYRVVNTVAAIKLSEVVDSEAKMKNDIINVGIKVLNFIILLIGVLVVLFFAGVNLTAVLSGLGIGGFAVAFAAKDTISNFFGTISILFSDVFSQGDWVSVNGHDGVVVEIGLRVTTLRTFDNALIAIPNGTFASTDVKNWNKRTLGRRIKMSIGVKYDSKSEDIRNAIKEIRQMLEVHPGIATKETQHEYQASKMAKLVSKDDLEGVKRTLLVYLDEFAASSINILIYCFSSSVLWKDWLETKEDVMHNIMEILERNNLEFAFPSLSVYNEKSALDE